MILSVMRSCVMKVSVISLRILILYVMSSNFKS